MWKDPNTCEKRPTHVKRDQHMWKETIQRDQHIWYLKETSISEKRPIYLKRNQHTWKEIWSLFQVCVRQNRPTHVKGDPQKRPVHVKRDQHMWKETNTCEMRPTHVTKDPHMWKETNTCEKRPTPVKGDPQKRPVHVKWGQHMWKETNTCEMRPTHVKRDQHMRKEIRSLFRVCLFQKRPADVQKETNKCEKRPTNVKRDQQKKFKLGFKSADSTRSQQFLKKPTKVVQETHKRDPQKRGSCEQYQFCTCDLWEAVLPRWWHWVPATYIRDS